MRMARIGVLLDRKAAERRRRLGLNVFQAYLGEILHHAGIAFEWIDRAEDLESCGCDLILIALAEDDKPTKDALLGCLGRGAGVIAYGGLGGAVASHFGCQVGGVQGAGYARLTEAGEGIPPLRYLRAQPWLSSGHTEPAARAYGTLADRTPWGRPLGAALLQFDAGAGFFDRWTVDIPATVALLQQGSQPVTEDGPPAPDGSAALNDGFLKADDVYELDWESDRERTETGQPYFACPYADLWREALVGHLLRRALGLGLTVPFVGFWPDGVERVAVISHDSDGNLDEEAHATLELLRECGIRSTWCMLEPGYSAGMYDTIREAGHELAFHYNAVEPDRGVWEPGEFARQLQWLRQSAGIEGPVTNKNHLTRMEGWGEFFRWCEQGGVTCDSSRGPSKKGNVGFLYGTCHPYFPIAWADEDNRLYDVLEIGFLTQDMDHGKWADSSVIVPFLEAVSRVHGVAHFLVHQYHIYRKEEVRQAMRRIVAEAAARGFAFWTIREIELWERLRRSLRVSMDPDSGAVSVQAAGDAYQGWTDGRRPVVWIPVADGTVSPAKGEADGTGQSEQEPELRYGVWCRKVIAAAPARKGVVS